MERVFAEMLPRVKRAAAGFAILLIGVAGGVPSRAADPAGVRWGAVGHNDRLSWGSEYPYNKISLQQQMHFLTAAGMNWYRTSCESANCNDLINAANSNGISILKSINLRPDATADEAGNYARAYSYAVAEGNYHNFAFTYFEASNELDNWVGMTGDGSGRSQYDPHRYHQARGLIRGLIDGIHSTDAAAKVLVDDAGWCHYGFLQMLWEDGVRWDITAVHWYSDQGDIEHAGCKGANVAAIHASFGRPVWVTEFNYKELGTAAATWIPSFMSQIRGAASNYRIEAAFVYELLDEPSLQGLEAHFGILDQNGNAKAQFQAVAKNLGKIAPKAPDLLSVN
ncbi:MAG: glycoside hydrolase family protein [Pseudomonadota bacterium]|nr:glycoside hydrolase family protein [Pseudomonadota bacterium]